MTDWCVFVAKDDTGAALAPTSVELRQGTSSHAFGDVAGQGLSLDLGAVAPGAYSLVVTLPNRPELPLAVGVKTAKTGKLVYFRGRSPAAAALSSQSVSAGPAKSRTLHVIELTLGKSHEEVVLVAGWDYSGGANNALYAKTWRDDLYAGETHVTGSKTTITRVVHDFTVVTLFDFKTGLRTRWLKGRSDWHELDSVLQGTVPTHTASYKTPANTQKRHDDDSISIVHVYDYIIELGAAAPRSLMRFDIFSHAWAGGPILANTDQDEEFATGARHTERDPGDKDGRDKDFTSTNMPRRADFRKAFASDGVAKVWGCFATTDYRRLIRGAAQAPDETTLFTVRTSEGEVEVTGERVKNFFRVRLLPETYMGQMAMTAGITVYGAPPGMGADLRAVGKKNYMFVNQSVYRLEYGWYKDALGLEPDESGHIPFR